MKTTLYLVMALLVASCAAPEGAITGKITGAGGKTVHLLAGRAGLFDVTIDSAVIREDGRFEFKGELPVPGLFTLKIFLTDERRTKVGDRYIFHPEIPVFVEKGRVRVEAALDEIPRDTTFAGRVDYSAVRVTPSRLHDLYMEYKAEKARALHEYMEVYMDYYDYKYGEGKYSAGKRISEGVTALEKLETVTKIHDARLKRFIARNKDNAIGLFVFQENAEPFTVTELDEILASFTPGVKATAYYKHVADKVNKMKRTAVGARFADFTLKDADGNPVRVSDHVGKGRYLLLDFWASWCGPCVLEIPHLKDAYELYHPAGFDVISISIDDREADWRRALEKTRAPWPQLLDEKKARGESRTSDIYNVHAVPTCVLISPDGVIVDRDLRVSRMDRKLIELYGNRFGDKY